MKMAYSGALWCTVFKVKMPVRKGLKIIFFAFTSKGGIAQCPYPLNTPLL